LWSAWVPGCHRKKGKGEGGRKEGKKKARRFFSELLGREKRGGGEKKKKKKAHVGVRHYFRGREGGGGKRKKKERLGHTSAWRNCCLAYASFSTKGKGEGGRVRAALAIRRKSCRREKNLRRP